MKEAVVAFLIISLVIVLEILVASLPAPLLLLCASLAMLILIPATYLNLRNRRNTEKGTDYRDQDSTKRALQILRTVAVVLLLTIWSISRYRISGEYSYRSRGGEQFVPEVAEFKHWPQSLFISPGVHHLKRQSSGLTHVGMKEDGHLKRNGVRHGMAVKRYPFRKSILQI